MRWFALAAAASCFCVCIARGLDVPRSKGHLRIDFQTAPDGRTRGWLVQQHLTDSGQEWRTFSQELVIVRNGHVFRRFKTEETYWGWRFWSGGKQIVLEEGGMHGPTACELIDLESRRRVATIEGCNDDQPGKPDWAQAVLGRSP